MAERGYLLDKVDLSLLNIIQEDFPLTKEPYAELGQRLELTENEVMERIAKLKKDGIIRRIGAFFNSRKIGYVSTLCAIKVPEESLEKVTNIVNSFSGVTHNYLREDEYNMWFTLIGPCRENLEKILAEIEAKTNLKIMELPAEQTFKIRVNFNFTE
ncbi:MAG: siroheme decarboxylase [Clostridia bacterium]|nr:siroheme decarboxylase [Clostridia bacterium]